MKKSSRAFTLIELLAVITIITILASLAFPVFSSIQEKARATQDLSNLRQLGIATQTYLNDHDGILFTVGGVWMNELHPKYLPGWKIFQSPFDQRASSEDSTTAPISYGLNGNSVVGISTDKIKRPSAFILMAPAPNRNPVVTFTGTPALIVSVYKDLTFPGGPAVGGTHNKRTRINALFADLHVNSLTWTDFKLDQDSGNSQGDANFRWDPAGPVTP